MHHPRAVRGLVARARCAGLRPRASASAAVRTVVGIPDSAISVFPLQHPSPGVPRLPGPPVSAEEAVSKLVKSGSNVFVHTAAATPTLLLETLANVAEQRDLKDIKTFHLHIEGPVPHVTRPGIGKRIRDKSYFVGANLRQAVNAGLADYSPTFLSEVPILFRRRKQPVDVAFVTVSPADKHGFHSLGTSVDVSRAALEVAQHIVAVVNPNMPRTFGDGTIHHSHIDFTVESDAPLFARHAKDKNSDQKGAEEAIGKLIAENLVENGCTLQMGIGGIPDAVLTYCTGHKDLGVHTEMFSDGLIPLLESGVVNNSHKASDAGKVVSCFAYGSPELYKFMDDNPSILMLDASYTNDTAVIRRHPKMTAINSCIEIDLTGQIVSDSIGTAIFSGIGGQMDFIRGASLCPDGRAIIAMPSRTGKGISRITPFIKQGAGVVTTRAHAHYVATEYGIVDMFGKTLQERARQLISVAHPDDRAGLEKAAFERGLLGPKAVAGATL